MDNLYNISNGKYKGARPLYVYIKKQHIGVIPSLKEFAEEYVSSRAISQDGYLTRKGLVALPKKELDVVVNNVKNMIILKTENVK